MYKILTSKKIILILFLALIFRIGHVLQLGNQPPTTHDGLVFDDIATNIIEKGRFQIGPTSPERRIVFYDVKDGFSWREPLYPFFLAFIYKIFGHSFIAVRLIEACIDVFTVFLVYIIGLRFFNRSVALPASLLIAVYPPFISSTGLFIRETLLIFLTTVLMLYLMKISNTEQVSYRDYMIIGMLLGIIALLKAVIILFVPFLLLAFLFKHRARMKSFIKISTATFSMMALVVLPWTARNFMVHHKFVPIATSGGINFLIGNNPNASGTNLPPWPAFSPEQKKIIRYLSEADQDKQYFKWGIMYVRDNPLRYLKLAVRKCLIFWFDSYGSYKTIYGFSTRVLDAFLLICGFYGILCSFTTWKKYQMAYVYIIAITVAQMVFFVVIRNRFLIIPLLSLFSVSGMTSFVLSFNDFKSANFIKKKSGIIVRLLFTAILILGYLYYHLLRFVEKIKF